MHVALLFPPGTDPRNPHLAIPSLAATLRAAGVRTTVRDLDLEALLACLEPGAVAAAAAACAARLGGAWGARRARLEAALADADLVCATVAAAPATLRDPVAFYDPHRYHAARECIARALELASAAASTACDVHYNIGPVRYDVVGAAPERLDDLARVTGDPRANLFDALYRGGVLPALERDRPDLVGVSILNHQQIIPGLTLARLLKARGHRVVIGGTVYAKFVDVLRGRPEFFRLFCDGVIAYEGETALLALLDAIAGGGDFDRVPNFLHLGASGLPTMGPRHAEDVAALPTPYFDGLPLADYLAPAPVLPILMGKGCYFNRCRFCDIPYINQVARKAYRVRPPERVAADVAALAARHGARHFEITDEALAPKLLLRLGEALAAYPDLEPRFVGFARLEPGFTPEVCGRLFDMGVRKLYFGLESGSQATLDHMNKGIRVDDAGRVLRHCRDAGIAFHVFSIVGFPEETEARARETLGFFTTNAAVVGHPRNSFDVHRFTLDLRTEYGDDPERFGARVAPDALAGLDFPLSIAAWENTRGISAAEADRLLAEFHAVLRHTFADYHPYPRHLWPDWATYAVLYADHYAGRAFPYRAVLPAADDRTRVRLSWVEGVRVEPTGPGEFRVRAVTGEGTVATAAVRVLSDAHPAGTAGELLAVLADELVGRLAPAAVRAAAEAALRALVDDLLGIGALRLDVVPADGPADAGAAAPSLRPVAVTAALS